MELSFGPDDPDRFSETRDKLAARFEATLEGADRGWVARQVLDFKWGYLDGDLGGWTEGDIEVILLDLYPAKAMLGREDLDEVIDGFAGFLQFLAREELLDGGEEAGRRLGRFVTRLGPMFQEAAFDESRWSWGKRLWSAAQAEGVDPSDAESARRCMHEFNLRPLAERDAILGPLPSPAGRTAGMVGPLPPVVLASVEELKGAARASVWVERLARFVDFVGTGRPLTDRGNLKLADG